MKTLLTEVKIEVGDWIQLGDTKIQAALVDAEKVVFSRGVSVDYIERRMFFVRDEVTGNGDGASPIVIHLRKLSDILATER